MLWLKLYSKLMDGASDGSGAGGAGGGAGTGGTGAGAATQVDLNDPVVKAAIDAAVANQTNGLVTKRDQLLGEVKKLKEQVNGYNGVTPEQVAQMTSSLQNDEEKKLISEGKLDQVVANRTERMVKSHQQALEARDNELATTKQQVQQLQDKAIASAVKSAAASAGALPAALDDFVSRANGKFVLTDDYQVVAVDKDGNVLLDVDGKTPLTVESWAKSLKTDAPHLFTPASGGGSRGGHGSSVVGKINGTPEERMAYISSKTGLPQG